MFKSPVDFSNMKSLTLLVIFLAVTLAYSQRDTHHRFTTQSPPTTTDAREKAINMFINTNERDHGPNRRYPNPQYPNPQHGPPTEGQFGGYYNSPPLVPLINFVTPRELLRIAERGPGNGPGYDGYGTRTGNPNDPNPQTPNPNQRRPQHGN